MRFCPFSPISRPNTSVLFFFFSPSDDLHHAPRSLGVFVAKDRFCSWGCWNREGGFGEMFIAFVGICPLDYSKYCRSPC